MAEEKKNLLQFNAGLLGGVIGEDGGILDHYFW
jgi:hypothetical protein